MKSAASQMPPHSDLVRQPPSAGRLWKRICAACGSTQEHVTSDQALEAAWVHYADYPCAELRDIKAEQKYLAAIMDAEAEEHAGTQPQDEPAAEQPADTEGDS